MANRQDMNVSSNLSSLSSNVTETTVTDLGYQWYFIFDDQTQRVALGVFFVLVGLAGIFGNSLVIFAVLISRKLRTVSNVFVVNLSVADLIVCIVQPGTAAQLFNPIGDPAGPHWFCALIPGVAFTSTTVSVFTLASLSVTRVLVVTRPLSHKLPRWLLTLWVMSTWLAPSLLVITPQIVWKEKIFGYNLKYGMCAGRSLHPKVQIFNAILSLAIFMPMIILVISSTIILISIKRQSQSFVTATGGTTGDNQSDNAISMSIESNVTRKKLQRRQIQITKNMALVVIVFSLCNIPYVVALFLYWSDPLIPYLVSIVAFSSCINPLIYAKHPYFREIFILIFKRKWNDVPEKSNLLMTFLRLSSKS